MTEQHPKTVILELPFGALAGWPVVLDAFRKAREATGYHLTFNGLIDQIERQLPKPKPEEPTGLGAVVRDVRGLRFIRCREEHDAPTGIPQWRSFPGGDWRLWCDIDVADVLSEGVTL